MTSETCRSSSVSPPVHRPSSNLCCLNARAETEQSKGSAQLHRGRRSSTLCSSSSSGSSRSSSSTHSSSSSSSSSGDVDISDLRLSASSEAKQRFRRLQATERTALVSGMLDAVKKAAAFRLANMAGKAMGSSSDTTTAAQWKKSWNKMVLDAKARNHGQTAGCEGVAAKMCTYYFKSIFLLHRGCKRDPLSVNAVQILSDTVHAVSCGDDGLCWVWKISSGTPRQVFFPYRNCPSPKPLAAVYTVSVLNDATYIVSADASGTAYIWDWRLGHQKTSTSCSGGPYLSSTEMPAWRMVLLGCNNSYTYVWQWDTGNTLALPYNARSTAQIIGFMQSNLVAYKNTRLDGMQRLFAEKAMMTEKVFLDVVLAVYPGLKEEAKLLSNISDFFHKNTFGAVNAVCYVPTRLRFVTGHADGRVRYWSAESGTLLMVMRGHQGPVKAVAPSPTSQEAVSGGEDGTVRLWCLKTGIQKLLLYQPYGGPVLSLAIVPGGTKVVVGSADGYVRIWDLSTGLLLCAINTGGGAVNGLAVNPSNPVGQIITASQDGYARVFNPR